MARTNAHRACDDFHRSSEATRRRFLGESDLTRRQLLGYGLGAGLSIYAAQAMPFARVLEAAEAEAAAAPDAPVLVAVFLPGGLDLLDSLVPLHDFGTYAALHPKLKIDNPPKLGSTGLGIHPSLANGLNGGIKGLFDAGRIGFLPGVDYSNPDLSHFHSRHFWETGLINPNAAPGWLGRWLDHAGSADNPLQGLSLGYDLSPVMRSAKAPVAAVASPGDAGFYMPDVWGEPFDAAMLAYGRMASGTTRAPGLNAARTTARLAKSVGDQLKPYAEHDGVDPLAPSVPYPKDNRFGDRLHSLAALIAQPLGIRVAAVQADGDFDTHDNQVELVQTLTEVSEALSSFQADLEARGVANRVLTLVWSEFGRRPEENDTGTDHGAGGIGWVMGTRARAGVLSDYPSLSQLDGDDNLQVTIDFRRVYASLLEQWLATDANAVIPNAGAFGRVQVVA